MPGLTIVGNYSAPLSLCRARDPAGHCRNSESRTVRKSLEAQCGWPRRSCTQPQCGDGFASAAGILCFSCDSNDARR